jgi:hypothetical protein
MMKNLFKTALSFMLLLEVFPGMASDFETESEKVIRHPVAGDLYVGGGTILVNARVGGDLVAAGGTIVINDSITGDALLAGGNLLVNGAISDDIRAAGGKIRINTTVQGDVVIAGGEIEIGPQALIRGDLVVTSGKATVNGTIGGQVKLYGGELHLNGKAENGLVVKGGQVFINGLVRGPAELRAEKIILQQKARFHGDVQYWQPEGAINFQKAMVGGQATFRPDMAVDFDTSRWYYLGFGSLTLGVIFLASALLLLFLFQFILARFLAQAGAVLNKRIPRELGYGLLYVLGLPVLSVLLLITVIGIPVGIFTLFFYLFTIVMGHIISSLVLANWYNNQYRRNWTKTQLVFGALTIFIALKLLLLVPFAGWLLSFALILLAFGAIIDRLQSNKMAGRVQPV